MADTTTTTYGLTKPEVGASEDTWGTKLNTNFDTIDDLLDGTTAIAPNLSTLTINGTAVTATAAELNIMDGVTATTAELNILDGVTATAAEINILDGVTATTDEINHLDGVTSNVQTQLNSISMSDAYPVGSIYMNASNSTNPATLLGFGTWAAFGAGRMPVGIDSGDTDFDTAEETGGAKTHALTEAEMPKHYHSLRGPNGPFTSGQQSGSTTSGGLFSGGTPDDGTSAYGTESTGGGASSGSASQGTGNGNAHNNMPPYIVVYMWKRTA
jgi:uncharacterized membrane protein YgcG